MAEAPAEEERTVRFAEQVEAGHERPEVIIPGEETFSDEEQLINDPVDGASADDKDAETWRRLSLRSRKRRKKIEKPWYKHQGFREHRHIVITTIIIDILAIGALAAGIAVLAMHNFSKATVDGVVLLIAGTVMCIPGGYFTHFLLMAAHNKPGYDFASLKRYSIT